MTWQSMYNHSVYSGLGNKRYNSRLGNIKSYYPSAPWVARSLASGNSASSHLRIHPRVLWAIVFIIIHQTAIRSL